MLGLQEKNTLYDEQMNKILNFVELLRDSLTTEHGKVQLCLYHHEKATRNKWM